MGRLGYLFVTVLHFSLVLGSRAFAEGRVALVIGNSAYKYANELPNPKNDAADLAASLKRLGFEVVSGVDLDKGAMDRKIRDFANSLSGADAGLFFYAGHGLQVGGVNYLVPVDAQLTTAAALDFEMVRLDLVQRTMERESKTNILFLDACRDNPLARNLARAMGTRGVSIGRGLAAAESGVGTLISYSTQPGNVALDGDGRNSPFAGALVKFIATPGDDLSALLINVRRDVMQATKSQQVPWEHSALTGRFYFSAEVSVGAVPAQGTTEAERAWQSVQTSDNALVLEAFRKQFGTANPFYDSLAADRIASLRQGTFSGAPKVRLDREGGTKSENFQAEVKLQSGDAATTIENAQEDKDRAARSMFRDCEDVCPEMIVIPAGEFVMGSPEGESGRRSDEGPQRKVKLAASFAVGKYEVTFAQWDACVADGGCTQKPSDKGWGRGNRPVINVSWDDATEQYLPWLSKKAGKNYRLLTESEWEYAARAGTSTAYAFGNSLTKLLAQFSEGEWGSSVKTLDVGSFEPNAFGLFDVHGNVWEWVQDCWNSYDKAPSDGTAKVTNVCSRHVVRGGSWYVDALHSRSAVRDGNKPSYRDANVGLRVARTFAP